MSERFGFRSEFAPLEAVLLHWPRPEVGSAVDPAEVLYVRAVDFPIMEQEYAGIRKMYEDIGIRVHWIEPSLADAKDSSFLYNLMYARDLFFMAPRGAVLSSMAKLIRRGEPVHAARSLKEIGIPIAGAVEGKGTLEGADALWVNDTLVAVGVGNRTNREGFEQLAAILKADGVECVPLPPSTRTQHLLGAVQFVMPGRALVRTALVEESVTHFLEDQRIEVIPVPEIDEVSSAQSMNVVVTAPGRLVMPTRCPRTRAIYERAGLTVAAETDIS